MKKLFLKDGKLFVGEFPEEPIPYGVGDEQYFGARMDEYYAACSAAREKAAEIVNSESAGLIKHWNSWFIDEVSVIPMQEGQLHSIPKGWDVEYEDIPDYDLPDSGVPYSEFKKIARLVPMAEKGAR